MGRASKATKFGRRVDERLREEGKSKVAFAQELGISRRTLENWINGVTSPDSDSLRVFAKLLRVSPEELAEDQVPTDRDNASSWLRERELRRSTGELLRAIIPSLHRMLDLTNQPDLIDSVVTLLRRKMPERSLVVFPHMRGRRKPLLFHWYIGIPLKQGEDREHLRDSVKAFLHREGWPVGWEHSSALLPEATINNVQDFEWLIVPSLLDETRPRPWFGWEYRSLPGLVGIGVWYTGIDDIAAMIARSLGWGCWRIPFFVARASAATMINPLRSTEELAKQEIFSAGALTLSEEMGGPYAWSFGDPEPVLSSNEIQEQIAEDFPGFLLFVRLGNNALAYAAHRSACAQSETESPPAHLVAYWRDKLDKEQTALATLADARAGKAMDPNGPSAPLVLEMEIEELPAPQAQSAIPDDVDGMFDHYRRLATQGRALIEDRLRKDSDSSVLARAEEYELTLADKEKDDPIAEYLRSFKRAERIDLIASALE